MASVKTIPGGTPVESLFAEFPDLIRPVGVQREVRHNTLYHIRTTPGPLVTFRPRRLAPDRLAVAKAEFDAMKLDGKARLSDSPWSSVLHSLRRLQTTKRPDNLRSLRPSYP
jgi:hypothetical protein